MASACKIWLTTSPLVLHSLGPESRMPRNGACPVREGAVGFPSQEGAGRLPHECLLRYAWHFIQKTLVDIEVRAIWLSEEKRVRVPFGVRTGHLSNIARSREC